jgi:hypothetical protein
MTNALNMLLAISLFRTSLPLAERERFASVSNNTHAPVNAIVFGKVEGDTKAKGSIKARRARKTKRAAKLKWPVKAKRTKKTKLTKTTGTTKKTAPHFFSRLPAELRARIWAIAVNDQIEQVSGRWPSDNYTGNTVTIHEHKEVDGEKQLSITSTRGYPTLFAVNREARYEAAKIDGGAWYTLGTDAPEVYVSRDKERVYFATCCNSVGWFTDTRLRSKAHETTDCIHLWYSQLRKDSMQNLIRRTRPK